MKIYLKKISNQITISNVSLLIHCALIFITTPCHSLSTSLIIPCYAGHAKHLYQLLKIYEKQTILPDEVIISLSQFDSVNPIIIEKLQNQSWQFPILLLASNKRAFAGENRNRASAHANGDIFIYQDADDFPHPQRIEIIKYFFEKYNVDLLAHTYLVQDSSQAFNPQYDIIKDYKIYTSLDAIPFKFTNNWKESHNELHIQHGVVSIDRKVFDAIKWPNKKRAQDALFTQKVYGIFKNIVVASAPLYIYRYFLSSIGKQNNNFNDENFNYDIINIIKSSTNNKKTIDNLPMHNLHIKIIA